MARRVVDVFAGALLHHAAEVHDLDAIGETAHNIEVMGNHDVRETEIPLQVLQQVDDLRLHRHVERRHGLVTDDHARLHHDGTSDANALTLTAGKLVREAVVVLGIEPHALHCLLDPALTVGRRADAVDVERLLHRLADAHARVERRDRVLEDHRDLATEVGETSTFAPGDVLAHERDRAGVDVLQAHQAAG